MRKQKEGKKFHRHIYRISLYSIRHAHCIVCGETKLNPHWPMWKRDKGQTKITDNFFDVCYTYCLDQLRDSNA